MKIILVGILVGIPLLILFAAVVYTYNLCFKYIKDHKR